MKTTKLNKSAWIAMLLLALITAGAQAKGIQKFAYGYEYCDCPSLPDSIGLKSSSVNYANLIKTIGLEIYAKPNPASTYVAFNYKLQENESSAVITITDVNGKMIDRINISGKQGQKIWDTRKIKQGVYFYTFTVNGMSKSGKIIISK